MANTLVQIIRNTENPNKETPIIFMQTGPNNPISQKYLDSIGVNSTVGPVSKVSDLILTIREYLK